MPERAVLAVGALLLLCLAQHVHSTLALSGSTCQQYNTTSKRDPSKLNVHLVPHTHDDSGWLKTFDQYFWGTRQDIQGASVQYVLSTVVLALKENPDRRFSYAEMSFFTAWWSRQSPKVQDEVRELVAQGRLDFINGGWVQHDEAAAHYVAMIDQTTRGHRFLNKTFGVTPRVGWQIDPFGHSSTQAALMSAAVGFEALFFGRADYQDMHVRAGKKQLEFLWRASASWGEYGQVFTHNYPSGNYGPPTGFNFDWGSWDDPIVDDPSSPEYNVPERVNAFVNAAHLWSIQMAGNDVLFMMGSDFHYANAHAWFINLDRLIHYVNLDGRVNVLYSTPAAYVDAKAAYSGTAWPVKTDDIFPYADCPHCYWTGYFTSRPTSKGYIRQATAYLAAARQLQALVPTSPSMTQQQQHARHVAAAPFDGSNGGGSGGSNGGGGGGCGGGNGGNGGGNGGSSLDALEAAVSLTQHHDAVTGTEKQAVANDYARYLHLGLQEASHVVNAALTTLLTAQPPPSTAQAHSSSSSSSSSNDDGSRGDDSSSGPHGRRLQQLLHRTLHFMHSYLFPSRNSSSSADRTTTTSSSSRGSLGLQLVQCPLLNVSVCGVTVAATAATPADTPTAVSSDRQQGAAAAAVGGVHDMQGDQISNHVRQLKVSPRTNNQQHISNAVANHPITSSSSSSSGGGRRDSAAAAAAAGVSNTDVSSSSSSSGGNSHAGVLVVVYNSLGVSRQEVVRVPVSQPAAGATYNVQDAEGASVPVQLLPVSSSTTALQQGLKEAGLLPDPSSAASHELAFTADLPPLGYATYALTLTTTPPSPNTPHAASTNHSTAANAVSNQAVADEQAAVADEQAAAATPAAAGGGDAEVNPTHHHVGPAHEQSAAAAAAAAAAAPDPQVTNGVLNLTLHAVTGRLLSVSAADGSWVMSLTQELMWYKSSTGDTPAAAAAAAAAAATAADRDTQATAGAAAAAAAARGQHAGRGCGGRGGSKASGGVGCSGAGGVPDGGQSSGAYIFRPDGQEQEAIPLLAPDQPVSVSISSGPVLTEVVQVWNSWATLTTRLRAGADTIEQEWTVGPIPTADGMGKEVIVRTTTDMQTGGVFFTDSNGREMLMRRINHRPSWPLQVTEPVAGNYYPITSAAALTDGCIALGVATDRAQGAASLADGQLEIMMHRVTVVDDARGVGEPLNETLCGCTGPSCSCPAGGLPARGRHLLVIGPAAAATATMRSAQLQLNDPPILAFADLKSMEGLRRGEQGKRQGTAGGQLEASASKPTAAAAASASTLPEQQVQQQQGVGLIAALSLQGRWSGAAPAVLAATGLPPNLHLLTLVRAEEGDPSKLILRLAHSFQVGEDAELSAPVRVDLQQLLAVPITDIQELSLTAAQYKKQQQRPRQWKAGEPMSGSKDSSRGAAGSSSSSSSWGQALFRQMCRHSGCKAVEAKAVQEGANPAGAGGLHGAGQHKQQHTVRRLQEQRPAQRQLGEGPYNIWDHSGDVGSVIELFPQEIRTWLVTVGKQ